MMQYLTFTYTKYHTVSMSKSSQKGFTLVELIIVMVIIGILATLGVGNFRTTRDKARDARRKSDLETISKSLEAYFNDHRSYPEFDANGKIVCKVVGETKTTCNWGGEFSDESGTVYSAKLPSDPAGHDYRYAPSADQLSFDIYARLDNPNDPDIAEDETGAPGEFTVNCGTLPCNYVVSSTNKTPPLAPTPAPPAP